MADDIVTSIHLVGCKCELCHARAEIERLREEVRHWHERAYLHAPHVVKQAWTAEVGND
jgi:hypothetical protein